MLLAVMRVKPSCAATNSRSIGYGTPARAPLPSGSSSIRSSAKAKRVASRWNISHVGEQVVREEHRLRALQVRVAGHDGAPCSPRRGRGARTGARAGGRSRALHAPFTYMRKSVATWSLRERAVCRRPAAGPIFSARRASTFMCTSSRSSRSTNSPRAILLEDLGEPAHDGVGVLLRDDPLAAEHARVRDRRGDVIGQEAHVDVDGGGVGLDQLVGGLLEAAAPELGGAVRGGAARLRAALS